MPRLSVSAAQIETCLQQGDDTYATMLAQAQVMHENGKSLLALEFFTAISDVARKANKNRIFRHAFRKRVEIYQSLTGIEPAP